MTRSTTSPARSTLPGARPLRRPLLPRLESFLPAYPLTDYTPTTENDGIPGHIQCVDNVIPAMTKRYERLGYHHNAVFALTHLLTTEEYKRF